MSQSHGSKSGTADEAFQEQCFLRDRGASVGADLDLFKPSRYFTLTRSFDMLNERGKKQNSSKTNNFSCNGKVLLLQVKVSLSKTLSPKLLLMSRSAPCMAASPISVWMCAWTGECGEYCKALWEVSGLEKALKKCKSIYHSTPPPPEHFHVVLLLSQTQTDCPLCFPQGSICNMDKNRRVYTFIWSTVEL